MFPAQSILSCSGAGTEGPDTHTVESSPNDLFVKHIQRWGKNRLIAEQMDTTFEIWNVHEVNVEKSKLHREIID